MSRICRACLTTAKDAVVLINANSAKTNVDVASASIHDKLISCVPELDLRVAPNSLLCGLCAAALDAAYNFKQQCAQTEERVRMYLQKRSWCFGLENLMELVQRDGEHPLYVDTIVKMEYFEEEDEPVQEEHSAAVDTFHEDFTNYAITIAQTDVDIKPTIINSGGINNASSCNNFLEFDEQNLLRAQSFDRGYTLPRLNRRTKNKYKCDKCPYSFPNRAARSEHQRSHTYSCDGCGFIAKNSASLKSHVRTHSTEKACKCDLCPYSTNKETALIAHSKVHTGENPFACTKCSRKFATFNNLFKHTKTHDPIHTCTTCNYSSKSKSCVKIHMKTHTGERPFKCDLCDYRAAMKGTLRQHIKTHDNECTKCDYRAKDELQLLDHMIHHAHNKANYEKGKKMHDEETSAIDNTNANIMTTSNNDRSCDIKGGDDEKTSPDKGKLCEQGFDNDNSSNMEICCNNTNATQNNDCDNEERVIDSTSNTLSCNIKENSDGKSSPNPDTLNKGNLGEQYINNDNSSNMEICTNDSNAIQNNDCDAEEPVVHYSNNISCNTKENSDGKLSPNLDTLNKGKLGEEAISNDNSSNMEICINDSNAMQNNDCNIEEPVMHSTSNTPSCNIKENSDGKSSPNLDTINEGNLGEQHINNDNSSNMEICIHDSNAIQNNYCDAEEPVVHTSNNISCNTKENSDGKSSPNLDTLNKGNLGEQDINNDNSSNMELCIHDLNVIQNNDCDTEEPVMHSTSNNISCNIKQNSDGKLSPNLNTLNKGKLSEQGISNDNSSNMEICINDIKVIQNNDCNTEEPVMQSTSNYNMSCNIKENSDRNSSVYLDALNNEKLTGEDINNDKKSITGTCINDTNVQNNDCNTEEPILDSTSNNDTSCGIKENSDGKSSPNLHTLNKENLSD